MKLILAKLIYITGIAIAIGLGFGSIGVVVWMAIMMLPMMGYILLGLLGMIAFGMLFGWAESQLEKSGRYGMGKN